MDLVSLGMMGGSLLSGIGGFLGGGQQARGAQNASQMSFLGAIMAQQAAEQAYQRASTAMSPYATAGSKSLDLLMSYLQGDAAKRAGIGGGGANLMSTFAPTMAQLEQTPGYQFTLSQGTKAAQNAAAGRGMGSSGNALQAGVDYATGLASTTFQQQLQNYLEQNKQAYNMLYGPSTLGGQAASGIANAAMGAGQLSANALMGAGNALGQGIMGSANALAGGTQALFGGLGSAAAVPYMSQMYNQRFGAPQIGQTTTNFGMSGPAFAGSGAPSYNLFGGQYVPTY